MLPTFGCSGGAVKSILHGNRGEPETFTWAASAIVHEFALKSRLEAPILHRGDTLRSGRVPLEVALPPHPRRLFNSAGIEALKQRIRQREWSPQWKAFQTGYDTAIDEKVELPPRGSNWFHWYVRPRPGFD
jgi:hypothetical protein